VGLTTPSVNERIKKLETRGFIRRFTALLDPRLVGMPLVAHVDVLLEHPRFERPFLEEIEALLDVQECYAISGAYGYRLKIRARDVEHLEAILREKIQTIRGVVRTHVELSLSIKKDSTLLPLLEGI
jgi:Lrp/AsnC family leucine-responsive transcriptional regulator